MNSQNTAAAGVPAAAQARLRLKKVFLQTLVISLGTCALVAVGALLYGTFNETTEKVLATLGALAVHSGMAMVCSASLERRRWPKLSTTGLIAFGLNFGVLITCIWVPGWFALPTVRAVATTGALLGFYILAIPCADLLERRLRVVLASAGLVACVVGFLMVLTCIWAEHVESKVFGKATAIACIVAFSFAHTCLLIRIPGAGSMVWLLRGTLACVWAVAALAAVMIVWELDDEFWFRRLGALGVLDASGSLALLIMAKLRQVGKVEKLQSTPAQVELRCPRCTTLQTVDAGAATCAACGLKFRLEIDEPRCANCDYLLWQLPERRCPECGTPF